MQLGFIGLGAMGLPMTRHLLEAGHQVTVASRSPGPVERAVSLGAVDGGSPAAVAEAGEIVILCVPSSPQVVEVVAAMLPALGPGKVVVDCSTIDPEVTRSSTSGSTGDRCRLPRRAPLRGHGRRRGRDAHPDGRGRRGDAGGGPTRRSTPSPRASSTSVAPGWARWSSSATT